MKFIVDVYFLRWLSKWLNVRGYDLIYILDLLKGNNIIDIEIIEKLIEEIRIVIIKDSDFLKYWVVKGEFDNILMVIIGNIINIELIKLFEENFKIIIDFFELGKKVIELSNEMVIVYF